MADGVDEADDQLGGAVAGGGLGAEEEGLRGDLLAARVSATGVLAGGRGATASAIETGPDTYRVTFGRDVSNCTYTATPQGATSGQTLAVEAGSNPQNVRVDADSPTAFQLTVIC